MKDSDRAARFAPRLLDWWDREGRHDLPWQIDATPYRIWVSEIMLQQTQVRAVERYFSRFTDAFPDVPSLAQAEPDDVLHLWSGLGYYSRARNLHKAARRMVDEHGGLVPASMEALLDLPGIGRSTAGAILALAFGQRHPILDGNVKRVLARLFAIEGWPGLPANERLLWAHAEACTPDARVANYTQAIMDFGATLCTRAQPGCERCPVQSLCRAYEEHTVSEIPAARPKKSVRPRRATVLVLARRKRDGAHAANEILLEKRPPSGVWGGLWSFPELQTLEAVEEWCSLRFGARPANVRKWPVVGHSFSHFDLDMTPVEVELPSTSGAVMDRDDWLWYKPGAPARIGIAAPVAKILERLEADRDPNC